MNATYFFIKSILLKTRSRRPQCKPK